MRHPTALWVALAVSVWWSGAAPIARAAAPVPREDAAPSSSSAPTAAKAVRFYLGIASSEGPGEERLRWAESDAVLLRDTFVDLGAVHPRRATLLREPSAIDVDQALASLAGAVSEVGRRGESTEVIVHYSGHGVVDALHLGDERYPLARLRDRLATIDATRLIVVVDACRTTPRSRGARVGQGFEGSVVVEPAPRGTVLLFAAREGEVAQESDRAGGAFFTQALVAGLRGAADRDRDGRVTLAEAWRLAHARTLAETHATARVQHPQLEVALAGEGEVVLTELSRARAHLVLDETIDGDVLVLDERDGRVLLEVRKLARAPLRLALRPGRIAVQVRPRRGDVTLRGEARLPWGGEEVIGIARLSPAEPAVVIARGTRPVDLSPHHLRGLFGVAASTLGVPTLPLRLRFERRLWSSPLLLGASVDARVLQSATDRYVFRHHVVGAGLHVAVDHPVGPGRVYAGAGVTALGVQQRASRTDEARLRVAGLDPRRIQGTTGAFGGEGFIGAALPLALGLSIVVEVGARGAVSGTFEPEGWRPWGFASGHASAGLELEF